MKRKIKVSIITPLYNSAPYIERTIQSVQKQSFFEWELIVIDDCSSDNGIQVVEEWARRDSRIKVLKNSVNSGAAISRNKGIEAAKGKYIAFLDSDDQWHKEKLEKQIGFMQEKNVGFTYSYYNHIDEEGKEISATTNLPEKVDYVSLMKSNKIGCLTAMYDTSFFGKVYMKNIRKRQDYTLWLQLLKKTKYAYCVPEVLATYTVRKGSVSSNKWSLIKYHWIIYRRIEKQSFIKSLYYLFCYFIYYVSIKFKK